jgi:surface antigen
MRPFILFAGVALGCTGCVAVPLSEPVITQVAMTAPRDNPNCRFYTAQALIDGKSEQIVGRACRQADGTWQITEGPPGEPDNMAAVYAPPTYANYGDYDPWLWEPPIGLSLGAVVFIDRVHHLHDGRHFAHVSIMHMHGMAGHRGFAHGSAGGMRHG